MVRIDKLCHLSDNSFGTFNHGGKTMQNCKKVKFEDGYVYRDEDGKWSFYDESNRPIGIFYNSIEEAIDALYKYMELV
jgi:hypothetical protein